MRVLFLGANDWANMAHRIARALVRTGSAEARVWTLNQHPYGYQEDFVGARPSAELVEFAKEADWLVAAGDGEYGSLAKMLDLLGRPQGERACIHAGTAYRQQPQLYEDIDKQARFRFRLVGCDSVRFSDTVRPFIPAAEGIVAEVPPPKSSPTVCHAPSKRQTKGTSAVLAAVPDVVLLEGLPYDAMRRARAEHEIVIDQLNPLIGGFGVTAVESMADGCAVIADLRHCAAAWRYLEAPPIVDVRTVDDLRDSVSKLIRNPDKLAELRRDSLNWAHRYASDAAVSAFWMGLLSA